MSQDLAKQNKMLKEYVEVLERQNNSRNIEKDVLLREISNLTQENDELRSQISKGKQIRSSAPDIQGLMKSKQQLQIRFRQVQNNLQKVTRTRIDLETENSKLKAELNNINNRFTALQTTNNELLKSKNDTQQLRKQSLILTTKQNDIARLETLNKQLREQISKAEQKHKNDLKQNQLKFHENGHIETQKLKQSMKKQLQRQNQEEMIKITTYFNDTLQKKDNLISELELKLSQMERESRLSLNTVSGELNGLRIMKKQLESKVQMAERQKSILEHKLKDLQLQFSHKVVLLNKREEEQQQLKNIKVILGKKEQQLLKSGSIIQTLKNNVVLLERKVKDLENQIESSREKNNAVDNKKHTQMKNLQGKYLRQIDQLKQKLEFQQKNFPRTLNEQKRLSAEKQRENQELKKIIAELSQNNNSLLQKLKLIQQRQEVQTSPRVQPNDIKNDSDLRNVVEQLRRQLKTVKSEFKKIEQDNKRMENFVSSRAIDSSNVNSQKAYPNVYDSFNRNLQQRDRKAPPSNQVSGNLSFKTIGYNHQQNEEPNVKYSKLGNGTEKYKPTSNQDIGKSMNRDKWELLQRRISQLRQQNAELKQSLYP